MAKEGDRDAVQRRYDEAKRRYAAVGVDSDAALRRMAGIPLSIHCWQGDDVGGFEHLEGTLDGGGIQATGNYRGKARTAEELKADYQVANGLIPGPKRFNLHAMYGEFGGKTVERDRIGPEHFSGWIQWAKSLGVGLDFNGTYFAHPRASTGFTLSSRDRAIRQFWIEHGRRCREIGAEMGTELKSPCVVNIWIPDGYKDLPADRLTPRRHLEESLDSILEPAVPAGALKDAVEGKLFGLGSESYVVGSHEFYLGYVAARSAAVGRPEAAARPPLMLCLDSGHYHPTESVADKITAILLFVPEILLHVSRGVRWDSDHVVLLTDDLKAIPSEVERSGAWERVSLALDFFDASINRIAAWVIGARAAQKAVLAALLEPVKTLQGLEVSWDLTGRLALMEEIKQLPLSAVWERYCLDQGVPPGAEWIDRVRRYEADTLSRRA